MSITESNNLIAGFLGWNKAESGNYMVPNTYPLNVDTGETECTGDAMQFHERWDWLIPVAKEIKKSVYENLKGIDLHIFQGAVSRWHPLQNEIGNLKLASSYYCAVRFIDWYVKKSKFLL